MTLILGWLEIIQRLSVHVKVASYYGPSSGAVFHHYIQTSGWDEYAQLEITKLLYSFHKDALLQNNFIFVVHVVRQEWTLASWYFYKSFLLQPLWHSHLMTLHNERDTGVFYIFIQYHNFLYSFYIS